MKIQRKNNFQSKEIGTPAFRSEIWHIKPLLFFFLFIVPQPAASQCINYDNFSHLVAFSDVSSHFYHSAMAGDYLIVTESNGLRVFDPRIPISMPTIAILEGIPSAHGIAVSGNFAFVTGQSFGFFVVDISDASTPLIVASLELPGSGDVDVSDGIAYVANSTNGVGIIDISDPLHPNQVAHVIQSDKIQSVAIDGNCLYAVEIGKFYAVDVTDPANPIILATMSPTLPGVRDVTIESGQAYLAAYNGLEILDVSDPQIPHTIGWITGMGMTQGSAVEVSGTTAFLTGIWYLISCDVSDPTAPKMVSQIRLRGFSEDLTLTDGKIFIPTNRQVEVVRLGNSEPVEPIGTALVGTQCKKVVAGNGTAFVLSWERPLGKSTESHLNVLDISDPSNPTPSGDISFPGDSYDLAVSEGVAFVSNYGLTVIDVRDPNTPINIGRLPINTNGTNGLEYSDGYVYLSSDMGNPDVFIIDVRDPSNPVLSASVDLPSYTHNLAVSGDFLYVASSNFNISRLSILRVTDPSSPVLVGTVDTPGGSLDVAVHGQYAFVADSQGGIQIVDVDNLTAPFIAYNVPSLEIVKTCKLVGNYLYTVNTLFPFYSRILDISNPILPAIVEYNQMGLMVDVDVVNGLAFVAADEEGLKIYPAQCGPGNVLTIALTTDSKFITIPGDGGDFSFKASISNSGDFPVWSSAKFEVVVPDGRVIPVFETSYMAFPAGLTISKPDIRQTVPAGAPAGDYIFRGWVGLDSQTPRFDEFIFSKEGSKCNSERMQGYEDKYWPLSGWDDELSRSQNINNPLKGIDLKPAIPNPFNAVTTIGFVLSEPAQVALEVFDVKGRMIRSLVSEEFEATGLHQVDWNGRDDFGRVVATGVYFYRLKSAGQCQTGRMVLVK